VAGLSLMDGEWIGMLLQEEWEVIVKSDELVFARTTPAMKLDIAKRIKQAGHRVAMTGNEIMTN